MNCTRIAALVAAIFLLLPLAQAQSATAERTSDEKALAEYRLSIAAIQKLLAATRAMAKVSEDPTVRAAAAKLSASDDANDGGDGYQSLNDMARKVDAFPPIASAIRSAGLTSREYMLITMSYMQAAMAAGMKKQGLIKELPKGTPAENVAFIEKNDTELQAIQKEFTELQKRMKAAEKEEPEQEPEQEEPSDVNTRSPKPKKK
jgi:hypothetical protein